MKTCRALVKRNYKTRKLYNDGDREGLRQLVNNSYRPLVKRIKKFYDAYSVQWVTENKPFGMEIQDARTGALIFRLDRCAERLLMFADRKLESIPELEEILKMEGYDQPQ